MQEAELEPLYQFLASSNDAKSIDVTKKYAFFKLGATDENKPYVELATHFVGFEDDEQKIELREPSSVNPFNLIDLWSKLGLEFLVANSPKEAFLFRLVGGLGLVEMDAALQEFPEQWRKLPSVRTGAIGFKSKKDLDENTFQKAASPRKRMKILNRDERNCRICGRGPANNADIELHLHHIRPWAKGGVTDPENLITLCHTCHKGLEPHFDASLFNYTNSYIIPADGYVERIRKETRIYRSKMLEILKTGLVARPKA